MIEYHPCFTKNDFGRLHLPVAPKCNIRCNYCSRGITEDHRPGAYDFVLKPKDAVNVAKIVLKTRSDIKVVGIAGPGEPLYNRETFETLLLLPDNVIKCLCTNGLLLPRYIQDLRNLGLRFLTITINSIDADVAAKIYEFVEFEGKRFEGVDAAELLVNNQFRGLKLASRFTFVKVNTVLIPGVNEEHIVEIAKKIRHYAVVQNIIPLIPCYRFSRIKQPSVELLREVRERCAKYIPQIYHCATCRADSVGKICERKKLSQFL